MADLTSTGVTIINNTELGNRFGISRGIELEVTIVLVSAGSGAASNKIPASAFGLTKITRVSPLTNSANTLVVVGAPNYAGTEILLKAAATNAPASYSDTFRCRVYGTA